MILRFGGHAKLLTNNLAAIDFTSRSAGIITTAKYEGNWHKEMFVESLSFAASTRGATFVAKVGMGFARTLPMVAMLTPMGVVILIGVGLAVAGASVYMDKAGKSVAAEYYDDIMKWITN